MSFSGLVVVCTVAFLAPLMLGLVPRLRARSFSTLVAREARALSRHGYNVTVTGPWPPPT